MADARGQQARSGDVVPDLPGYRIERQLGRGSIGVVYLAEDLQLRRQVALKILSPPLGDDELFRKRFDRESQSAAKLDHPHIVPVYAAGEAGQSLYIAMRYVAGGDLRALLDAHGPLSLEQATSIVASVADALDSAHAQGMIHRDVKPANILIDNRNGQQHYYLSDFGITKIISSGPSLTSTGQIIGTIDYIAPEQIQGKAVDGRVDLYALGCVLYQCLTAEVPFLRDDTAAAMWAHVHDEVPPITTRRPDLPPQVDHIVAKAMAKQPEDRYATCRELAIALRAAAESAALGQSAEVVPAGSIDRVTPPSPTGMTSAYTPPTPAPPKPPVASTPPRWRRRWLVATSVLVLAVLGGGTAGLMTYLGSRYPNRAEQQLLQQVPLALKDSCKRNPDAGPDAANVEASVMCKGDGDAPKTVVFTKFASSQTLAGHYQQYLAASGAPPNSGDCLNAERAESTYGSEPGRTTGRVVCYQQLSSSFVVWTDEQTRTLAQATRVDRDYLKARDWWAGVVNLPTRAELEVQAQARKQVEEAQKRAEEAQKRADEAARQVEEQRKQQAEEAQKRDAEAAQQAEEARKQQEQETRQQQALEAQKQADAAKQQADEAKKETQEAQQQLEAARQQAAAEEATRQNRNRGEQSLGESTDLDSSQRGTTRSGPAQQPPSAPQPTPNSPNDSLIRPPSSGAAPNHSTVFVMRGPAPAAPGPQQGGSPMEGSGGCTPQAAAYYSCTLTPPAPAYLPGTTKPLKFVNSNQSAFLCQSQGSPYSAGNRTNHWWAWVGLGNVGVWVPTMFLSGETSDGSVAGLPICDNAGAPKVTTNEPSDQRSPQIIIEPIPTPSTEENTDNSPR